jgi:hypothetical protein
MTAAELERLNLPEYEFILVDDFHQREEPQEKNYSHWQMITLM